MRISGLPGFQKLWGRIEDKLAPGNYTMNIQNNYIIQGWQGKKSFVLTSNSKFGAKNYLLAI